jgi:hypothetical protein
MDGDHGARKKRKRTMTSSAEQRGGRSDNVAPVSCAARAKQDTDTAIRLLFAACRPPLRWPDMNAAALEHPATLTELLAAHEAAVMSAENGRDGSEAAAQLPHRVTVRLLRYLETVGARVLAGANREGQGLSDLLDTGTAQPAAHIPDLAGIFLINLNLTFKLWANQCAP